MLLKRSGISQVEKTLVLSRMDLENKQTLFKEMKMHIKNILGKRFQDQRKGPADSIKLEPSYLVENEHVLAVAHTDILFKNTLTAMKEIKTLCMLQRK